MATRQVLADLTAAAAAAGLPAVQVESMGGVDAAKRVAAGEQLDLVFLASGALDKLATAGHVDASSVTQLVLSQVAMAVPANPGAPASPDPSIGPAFPNAEGVREALRGAARIGYSTGPSGTALISMVEAWGLSDELGGRLVQARPGVPVARSLADKEVDLGFQQLSELVGAPGIRILGLMPPDCAIETVFSGAVATTSANPSGAAEVLAYLASDATGQLRRDRSFALP